MKIFFLFILILLFPINLVFGEIDIFKIFPTDDAFVVYDENNPDHEIKFRDIKTGQETFIELFISENTENQQNLRSIIFIKFNLSDISSEEIIDAKLRLWPFIIENSQSRIDVFLAEKKEWRENSLTFKNRPLLIPGPTSVTVSEIDKWYSWDVKDLVKQNTGSTLTLGIMINKQKQNFSNHVVFFSTEAIDKIPFLEISLKQTISEISNQQDFGFDYRLFIIIGSLIGIALGIGILIRLAIRKKFQSLN